MAHAVRLMTRSTQHLEHHPGLPSLRATYLPSRLVNGISLKTGLSFATGYATRPSTQIWPKDHHHYPPRWSRALNVQQPTSPSWSKSCHSSQRRQFSHFFRNHENAKEEKEKDAASRSDNPADSPPEPKKPTIVVSAKAVTQRLKRLSPPVLKENIYTLPNLLTTTRIITAPIICYALLHSHEVLAFSLFAYSSFTDLVDGYLARHYKSGTVLGSILDPFADKLLMTLTTVSLYSIGTFPWWLTLIILGRDGGLALSALYFRWISLPPPRTMTRYWDFSLPSAEVRPTEISKINTLLQFLLVADAVLLPVLPVSLVESWNLWGIFEGWMGLVAGTTVWSGMSYIFTKDAIRFIGQGEAKEEKEEK